VAGDVHGDIAGRDRILHSCQTGKPELLIICGDVTNFGPASFVEDFISLSGIRTLAVPGNCDTDGVVEAMDRDPWSNIHGKVVEVDGWHFFGRGGAGRRSQSRALQAKFDLDDMVALVEDIPEDRLVLVLHEPPRGHLDSPSPGTHVGSRMLAELVSRTSPALVLSAHIHENPGIERSGGTLFVNPGPALDGNVVMVELDTKEPRARRL